MYIPHRQLLSLLAQPLLDAAAGGQAAASPDADHPQSSANSPAAQPSSDGAALPQSRPLWPAVRRRGATGAATATGGPTAPCAGDQAAARDAAGGTAANGAAPSDRAPGSSGGAANVSDGSRAAGSSAAGRPGQSEGGTSAANSKQPHRVTDAHVSLLLNSGLLARHASDRGLYLFGVPDTGPLVSACHCKQHLMGAILCSIQICAQFQCGHKAGATPMYCSRSCVAH